MSQPRRLTAPAQLIALSLGQLFALAAIAQSNKVTVQTVATGLHDPRAIAVRPETGSGVEEVFIAETGAGRVVKLTGKNVKPADVISGFTTKAANAEGQTAGVQSLLFIDRARLVATGGDDDGKPFVRLYELPDSSTPMAADQAKDEADLAETDQGPRFEAHAFGTIARSRQNDKVGDFLIVAGLGDRTPVGIAYVPVRAGTLGDVFPIRLSGARAEVAPTALAVGPTGYVVIASNADETSEHPSRLQFINPVARRIVMEVPLDLEKVTALAYSPKSGNLYAAAVSKTDSRMSGVFRIDNVDPSARRAMPVSVAKIDQPTALCFAPDNNLYVTTTKDKSSNTGTLVRISGEL